jgi:uncharacterized protein YqeY
MSLQQQIKSDAMQAMKAKDAIVSGVLRMALSSLNTKEKEKRYKIAKEKPELQEEELTKVALLTDEEMLDVISSEIKKRKDAIALYEQGGRPELAEGEKQEMEILKKYLPEQIPQEELKKMIEASIAKVGAQEVKDMGRVMADLMPSIKGRADTGEVSKIIKELLNG